VPSEGDLGDADVERDTNTGSSCGRSDQYDVLTWLSGKECIFADRMCGSVYALLYRDGDTIPTKRTATEDIETTPSLIKRKCNSERAA
jgi:hypothetical protein